MGNHPNRVVREGQGRYGFPAPFFRLTLPNPNKEGDKYERGCCGKTAARR